MKKRKQNLPRPAVHRMELWWAALPTVPGHVQRGTRPVVIVSNDLGNASSPVVSAVPCTTQRHKPALPTHVYLRGYGLSSGVFCQVKIPGFAKANSLVLPREFPGNCQINSLVLPRYFTRMRALRRR